MFASAQAFKLDDESRRPDVGADLTEQGQGTAGCATGGEQIVEDDHSLTGLDGIGLQLDRIRAVFQIVGVGDCLTGKLPGFPRHHEAASQLQGQRSGDQKSPAFDADKNIGFVLPDRDGQQIDGVLPCLGMRKHGRDVVKQDSRLWKIRDRANVVGDVHDVLVGAENQVRGCYRCFADTTIPACGTIDGVNGDHILLAPPFILCNDEVEMIVERLGDAVDAAIAGAVA